MSVFTRIGLICLLGCWFGTSTASGHGSHTETHENPGSVIEEGRAPWSAFSLSADLRPSSGATGGRYFMDNEVGLSYSIRRSVSASYTQRFQVMLNQEGNELEESGPDFHEHRDGFLQVNAAEIASIGRVILNYEGRLYVPTSMEKRNRGFITALGNSLKLFVPVLPSVTFCLNEGVFLHAYSANVFEIEVGAVANPLLENRVSVSLDAMLFGDQIRISLPFFWHQFFHNASRQNARFGNSWTHALWMAPEIIWRLTESTQIGLAYHSENLFADYTPTLGVNEGLRGGAFQAVYQISL